MITIQSDEELLFVSYWADFFRRAAAAAGTGICFRLLSTRLRRAIVDACNGAETQLRHHIAEYQRKKGKP